LHVSDLGAVPEDAVPERPTARNSVCETGTLTDTMGKVGNIKNTSQRSTVFLPAPYYILVFLKCLSSRNMLWETASSKS
jgi:hypothetical protein